MLIPFCVKLTGGSGTGFRPSRSLSADLSHRFRYKAFGDFRRHAFGVSQFLPVAFSGNYLRPLGKVLTIYSPSYSKGGAFAQRNSHCLFLISLGGGHRSARAANQAAARHEVAAGAFPQAQEKGAP